MIGQTISHYQRASDKAPTSLGHSRRSDQANHTGSATARTPKSVMKVGSKIEASPAIVGENSNVFATDGKTCRPGRGE